MTSRNNVLDVMVKRNKNLNKREGLTNRGSVATLLTLYKPKERRESAEGEIKQNIE
jgi:hypothetical protein